MLCYRRLSAIFNLPRNEKIIFWKMAISKEEMLFTGEYSSDFDDQESKSTRRKDELAGNDKSITNRHSTQIPLKSSFSDTFEKEERKSHMFHFLSMNAYSRHKKLVNDYLRYYGGSMKDFGRSAENDRTDHDVIRENHRFIWDEGDDSKSSWEKALARKYYDKLFKEYCISDLSRFKENKFAMRWRIEKEVIEGKGQFICGSKKCCEKESLQSWEVNFGYHEHGVKKNALVKLRLCPECSRKLNYHHKRKAVHRKRKHEKRQIQDGKPKKKKKKKHQSDSGSSDEEPQSKVCESKAGKKSFSLKPEYGDTDKPTADDPDNIWSTTIEKEVEKSREEELDDYLEELFL